VNESKCLRETPLSQWHRAHDGRMVEFAGYSMPVQYKTGVLAEHAAVREKVGIFDITHMGEIMVEGGGAEQWLEGLVTNKILGIAPGKVVYTAMCQDDGGVLDDMLIYRLAKHRWLVVCNAANHDKILTWFQIHQPGKDVVIDDASYRTALIAIQGPNSHQLITRLEAIRPHTDSVGQLDFYTSLNVVVGGAEWVVSRTGYTGEHGYEIYVPNDMALSLWQELITKGEEFGVVPVGLAARDTLRFEVCYCLYGHELSEDTTPLEAGIGWAVKFKKADYIGKEALQKQKAAGVPRLLIGLEVAGRTIARQSAQVMSQNQLLGQVTSGNYSPTLRRSLALALVASGVPDRELQVEVRGKVYPCHAVPIPFLSARVKGDPRAERTLPA